MYDIIKAQLVQLFANGNFTWGVCGGLAIDFFVDNKKLPKTYSYLTKASETIEQFNLRKLDRACEYLYRTEGKLIKWHVIEKAHIHQYSKEDYILNRLEELAHMYGCLE